MFETTEPGERAAHDVRQAVRDREQRDDQLRRIAEARVQEARRFPGPVCSAACSVDSPISQASGISARPERTNKRGRVGVERVPRDDGGGREGE